jgi:hypothetical protein
MKKKNKFKPFPMLKPGTYNAAQVLEFVADLGDEEEDRIDMRDWLTAIGGEAHNNDIMAKRVVEGRSTPPCGTVACLSGWINLAIRGTAWGAAVERLELSSVTEVGSDLCSIFWMTQLSPREAIDTLRHYIECYRNELESKTVIVTR